MGEAITARIAADLGLTSPGYLDGATFADLDAAYLEPDAQILELSPRPRSDSDTLPRQGLPRYRWSVSATASAEPDLPDNVTRLHA